jgi:archaellum component FlaG (FlaF/FlaG flagellin family)
MFIAVVTIAASLVFVFNQQISESAGSVSVRQEYLSNQLRTAVEIESVKYDEVSDQGFAYVRNVGDTRIYPNRTMVYVDSERLQYDVNLSFSIEEDTDTKNKGILDPEEIFKITFNRTLTTGSTHELSIVTQYNARDTYEFSS